MCAQRKRGGRSAAAAASDDDDDDDDDDDNDDADRYHVEEKGRTTFVDIDRVSGSKPGRQTDRDEDHRPRCSNVTSPDDFRFRCSAVSTYNKPVTNGTIAQHIAASSRRNINYC